MKLGGSLAENGLGRKEHLERSELLWRRSSQLPNQPQPGRAEGDSLAKRKNFPKASAKWSSDVPIPNRRGRMKKKSSKTRSDAKSQPTARTRAEREAQRAAAVQYLRRRVFLATACQIDASIHRQIGALAESIHTKPLSRSQHKRKGNACRVVAFAGLREACHLSWWAVAVLVVAVLLLIVILLIDAVEARKARPCVEDGLDVDADHVAVLVDDAFERLLQLGALLCLVELDEDVLVLAVDARLDLQAVVSDLLGIARVEVHELHHLEHARPLARRQLVLQPLRLDPLGVQRCMQLALLLGGFHKAAWRQEASQVVAIAQAVKILRRVLDRELGYAAAFADLIVHRRIQRTAMALLLARIAHKVPCCVVLGAACAAHLFVQREELPVRLVLLDVARAFDEQQHKQLHPAVVFAESRRIPRGAVDLKHARIRIVLGQHRGRSRRRSARLALALVHLAPRVAVHLVAQRSEARALFEGRCEILACRRRRRRRNIVGRQEGLDDPLDIVELGRRRLVLGAVLDLEFRHQTARRHVEVEHEALVAVDGLCLAVDWIGERRMEGSVGAVW
ncbi:hypothetical protein L1887_42573 [Cichorium endivia]|nr:hypothetical protein L1887_42573 [Cichorium endivia]